MKCPCLPILMSVSFLHHFWLTNWYSHYESNSLDSLHPLCFLIVCHTVVLGVSYILNWTSHNSFTIQLSSLKTLWSFQITHLQCVRRNCSSAQSRINYSSILNKDHVLCSTWLNASWTLRFSNVTGGNRPRSWLWVSATHYSV